MFLLSKKKKLQNSSPRGFVQATTNFSSFIVQEVFAGSSVGDGGHFCTRVANFLPPKFLPCHCNCRNSKWLFASSLSYTYVHYTILCTLYLYRLSNSTILSCSYSLFHESSTLPFKSRKQTLSNAAGCCYCCTTLHQNVYFCSIIGLFSNHML